MKKLSLFALVLALLLPVSAMAAGEDTTPATEAAAPVREIHTVEELAAIADDPTASYVLMNDLDMTGISWKGLDFRGTFDGNGHIIANLRPEAPGDTTAISYDGNVKAYDTTFYGLFATLNDATVKNLKLLNVRAVVASDVPVFLSALAGYSMNSTISDCTVTGSLELRAHDRMFGVAGVVGYGTGTVERCTVDVTLVCTDTDRNSRDEQFMAAVFATGFMDVLDCTVNIDGYSSEYGYAHNGGITGMYMQRPLGVGREGKLTGNTITGKITFFEWNSDRRAYCAAEAGEVLANWKDISGNTCDFVRDERREYDVELRPEMCESPEYTETVIPFGCDTCGYTQFTCTSCGYTYTDLYTLPGHTPGEYKVTLAATVDAEGEETAYCVGGCGQTFTRSIEKLPPPETLPPTEPAAETPEGEEAPQAWMVLVPLGIVLAAAVSLVIVVKNRGKR